MVSPHLPRYFRENDEMILSTQIQNISDKNLNGIAKIEFINPKIIKSLLLISLYRMKHKTLM